MATATDLTDVQPHGFFTQALASADPAVAEAIRSELHREQTQIELIASENIVSRAVLEAQGSVLTNKYAEGYPGRRYYQGCEPSDAVEQLAIDRAKQLFNCGFANVLALGARLIGGDMARACVAAFLGTDFSGGRHQRRVDMLSSLIQDSD